MYTPKLLLKTEKTLRKPVSLAPQDVKVSKHFIEHSIRRRR